MFDTDYEAPKPKKVPTLLQYLKSLPKSTKVLQQNFPVEVVWLPNKFQNVTLVTHAFRLILNDTHPLFDELVNHFGEGRDCGELQPIGITITERSTGAFKLTQRKKGSMKWTRMGTSGLRCSEQ